MPEAGAYSVIAKTQGSPRACDVVNLLTEVSVVFYVPEQSPGWLLAYFGVTPKFVSHYTSLRWCLLYGRVSQTPGPALHLP